MKIGSIVEYIGGQDPKGIEIFPLERNIFYEVTDLGMGKFSTGQHPYISIDVGPSEIGFIQTMFREVIPPSTVNLEELLKQENYEPKISQISSTRALLC